MSLVAFDTLKYASRLEKSGFERKQAAELAEVQMEVLGELMQEKLATKEDLRALGSDFETQIHETETKLQVQIHETETKLQAQISQLSINMKEMQNTLLRWMTTLFAGSIAALSFVMSAFKFLY